MVSGEPATLKLPPWKETSSLVIVPSSTLETLCVISLIINRHSPGSIDLVRLGKLSYEMALIVEDKKGTGFRHGTLRVAGWHRTGENKTCDCNG
jgi:hypothetical protein